MRRHPALADSSRRHQRASSIVSDRGLRGLTTIAQAPPPIRLGAACGELGRSPPAGLAFKMHLRQSASDSAGETRAKLAGPGFTGWFDRNDGGG